MKGRLNVVGLAKEKKTYVEEGRSTVRELIVKAKDGVSANASAVISPEVLRTAALPVIPQFIDHL